MLQHSNRFSDTIILVLAMFVLGNTDSQRTTPKSYELICTYIEQNDKMYDIFIRYSKKYSKGQRYIHLMKNTYLKTCYTRHGEVMF